MSQMMSACTRYLQRGSRNNAAGPMKQQPKVQRSLVGSQSLPIQPHLIISGPNDRYEREAGRVADAILDMPEPLQEQETHQAKSPTRPILSVRRGGQPLPQNVRSFFEPRFGHDFSQVRVHTGAGAAESAQAVNARAYTVEQDLVFGAGQYAPNTMGGRKLLAHELAHVVQRAPGIARANGTWAENLRYQPPSSPRTIPAPGIDTRGPLWEKAVKYEPKFRTRKRVEIEIPPPPIPETPKPPSKCPNATTARKRIRKSGLVVETEQRMRRTINLERSRAAVHKGFKLTRKLVKKADRAIRKEFGSLLPSGRNFASPSTISIKSPAEFAKHRIPNDNIARERIAEAAMASDPDTLHQLCITKPGDALYPVLVSEVVNPLLSRLKIDYIREYERSRTGGETTHTYSGGKWSRHVTIPNAHRHMGHILVHEAMHYYVHDTFFATAAGHPLEQQLHEGGAEYLARRAIHKHVPSDPAFKINYGSYVPEFTYVNTHLAFGSFPLAYLQGHVDLLGLTPRTTPGSTSPTL